MVRSRAVYDDVAETLAQCSTGTVTLTVCDDSNTSSALAAAASEEVSVTLEQSSTATVTLTVSPSATVSHSTSDIVNKRSVSQSVTFTLDGTAHMKEKKKVP